jgi:hypothetical protein
MQYAVFERLSHLVEKNCKVFVSNFYKIGMSLHVLVELPSTKFMIFSLDVRELLHGKDR